MIVWYLLLVLFIVLLIGWLLLQFSDSEYKFRLWGIIGLIAFAGYLVESLPEVIIIEDGKQYRSETLFSGSFETDDGVSHSVSNCCVYNKSSKDIVIYPVDYGTAQSRNDVIIIRPNNFSETEEIDYYFTDAPSQISVNSKQTGETKWVLDYLADAQERLEQSK